MSQLLPVGAQTRTPPGEFVGGAETFPLPRLICVDPRSSAVELDRCLSGMRLIWPSLGKNARSELVLILLGSDF
jgi:hypothetical protein